MIYVGYAPAEAGRPASHDPWSTRSPPRRAADLDARYFRDAFIVGAIAFVFPILILVGTATRLAAARREERYAALRLVGATSRQISVISSVDAVVSALLGTLLGIVIFLLLRPALADTAITSARYFCRSGHAHRCRATWPCWSACRPPRPSRRCSRCAGCGSRRSASAARSRRRRRAVADRSRCWPASSCSSSDWR